jgi:tetratricopeptide (TPR) repeat protein
MILAAISSCCLSLAPKASACIGAIPINARQFPTAAQSEASSLKGRAEINVNFKVDFQNTGLTVPGDSKSPGDRAVVSEPVLIANYSTHEDLLKCYQSLGRRDDSENEYRWLISAKPANARLHYNYACFLKFSRRFSEAAAEYEKAAQCDKTNADYAGQCGQMFLYLQDNEKAKKYFDRATQESGGDKYNKILFDARP